MVEKNKRMTGLVIGLGVAIVLAVIFWMNNNEPENSRHSGNARRGAVHQAAPIVLPRPDLGELPTSLPFIGPESVDKYGYPLRQPDAAALGALFHAKRFAQLTEYLESYQAEFDEDFHKEYWPRHAYHVFAQPDPSHKELFAEWIGASPDSYAPYLARGSYLVALARQARGSALAKNTSDKQFANSRALQRQAAVDIDSALAIRPGLPLAYAMQIRFRLGDVQAQDSVLSAALQHCPKCALTRYDYMAGLDPRWGGPRGADEKYSKEASALTSLNPRLKLLAAYPLQQKCRAFQRAKKWGKARQMCDAALELDPDYWSTRSARIMVDVYEGKTSPETLLPKIEEALEGNPYNLPLLEAKLNQLHRAKDWLGGVTAAIELRRISWVSSHRAIERFLDAASYYVVITFGQHPEVSSTELNTLVRALLDIMPDHASTVCMNMALEEFPDVQEPNHRGAIAVSCADVHSIGSLLSTDRILSERKDFVSVEKHWTRFIANNPRSGKAYLYRSQVRSKLGRTEDALLDANQSCTLKEKNACELATSLKN
ncbi:MAG: DUF4034 domain-containing protein [Kofleriaceae bacterium]|nr:DUF4034 domain-containing protein [Kofleriaceae bacterium]